LRQSGKHSTADGKMLVTLISMSMTVSLALPIQPTSGRRLDPACSPATDCDRTTGVTFSTGSWSDKHKCKRPVFTWDNVDNGDDCQTLCQQYAIQQNDGSNPGSLYSNEATFCCAYKHHDGSTCEITASGDESDEDGSNWKRIHITPSYPLTFCDYGGYWDSIGTDVSTSFQASATWSEEDSTQYSTSFTTSIKSSVGVSFDGDSCSDEMSDSVTSSLTTTMSLTKSGSVTYSCGEAEPCDDHLYQWKVTAQGYHGPDPVVDSDGNCAVSEVRECSFMCVSDTIADGPKCPNGACWEDDSCQCCNQVWSLSSADSIDYLAVGAGGTCTTDPTVSTAA